MLTPEAVSQFERNGFVVFDPGIAPATIDDAAAKLNAMYLPPGVAPETDGRVVAFRDDRRIQDAWKAIASVKDIALAPRVLETLRQLYGRTPRPFQTLNFRLGSEQKTHSDTVHFNSSPSGYMCGVWVALEDVDADNGPVVYYPGSHRWPEVDLADVDAFEAGGALRRLWARAATYTRKDRELEDDYPKYERVIEDRIRRGGIEPAYATIRKGQAFIWAANLLHGGSPQRDRARTRASQVTHYFFEGCRYYTPLMRRGIKTAWRQPQWIA